MKFYSQPLSISFVWLLLTTSLQGQGFMFQATVGEQDFEGMPLRWNASQMLLLARDGQLHNFDPRLATNARKTAPHFRGYSPLELREQLRREFGKRYSVNSTGHYLVVHPPGESDAWGSHFEELYRSFQHYFSVRGFSLQRPPFPLVAIVFPSQGEYHRHAAQQGIQLPSNTSGYYDPQSNRVYMYDPISVGQQTDWQEAASTILHEATHQTAYNVGLHRRATETPTWLVEGLAMLFEAPGVYASKSYDERHHRINRERLDDFRYFAAQQQNANNMLQLIASDEPFQTNGVQAYANAWALTFYLSETRPQEYNQYLRLTAQRPSLAPYDMRQRITDFQQVFGEDLILLQAHFSAWMEEL